MLQESLSATPSQEEIASPAETLATYYFARDIIKKLSMCLSLARGYNRIGTFKLPGNNIAVVQPGRVTIGVEWPDMPDKPALRFAARRVVVHFIPSFAWTTAVGADGAGTVGLAYTETDTVFVRVNGIPAPDTSKPKNKESWRIAVDLMDTLSVALNRQSSQVLMTTLHEVTHLLDVARMRVRSTPAAVSKRLRSMATTDDKGRLINSGEEQAALTGELIAAYSTFLRRYRRVIRRPFAKKGDENYYCYVFDDGIQDNPRLSVEAFWATVKKNRSPYAVMLHEPLLKPEYRKRAAARLAEMHASIVSKLIAEPVDPKDRKV